MGTRASWLWIYGVSLGLHFALAAAVSAIEQPPVVEEVRITIREVTRPRAEEPPPPPPPEPAPAPEVVPEAAPAPPVPEPPRPRRQAAPEAPPAAEAPAPPPTAAPLDFGVAMQGGVGVGGVAVPVGSSLAGAPGGERTPTRTASRTLEAPPPERAEEEGCAEAATRPRPLEMPQPAYTDEARAAAIEGRVRARITVDATGAVTDVQVLEGLGHGLDEAAIAAMRGARFEAATECGRAVEASFTISVRFTL